MDSYYFIELILVLYRSVCLLFYTDRYKIVKHLNFKIRTETVMAGGRQRTFDKQIALEHAMRVFWQKGYAGTSLMDLIEEMGINKPSMYSAFGNKEQLFISAMHNYIENYANKHTKYLYEDELHLNERLKKYLLSIITSQCGQDGPTGCFVSVCITESCSEDMPLEAMEVIATIKNLGEELLVDFFSKAQKTKDLSTHHNAKRLGQYFISILHGTAAMARAGKTKKDLEAIVETAMKVLGTVDKPNK